MVTIIIVGFVIGNNIFSENSETDA